MSELLSRRFDELESQLEEVLKTIYRKESDYTSGIYVDNKKYISWVVKAKNLVSKACGDDSLHLRYFDEKETNNGYSSNYDILQRLSAVFAAAKEDFEGGYCSSIRTIVQAEVFDNELEQANELLEAGYVSPAAVIAGVVLETTLRQLCDNHGIAHGRLDKMNADLVKEGQYNKLKQKQVTAWADIRNSAAHGHHDDFNAQDVHDMIEKVEAFVADQLS